MAIDINIFLMYNFSEKGKGVFCITPIQKVPLFLCPKLKKRVFLHCFGGSYGRYYI